MSPKKNKSYVRWTDDEKARLVEQAAKVIVKYGCDHLQAMRKAQPAVLTPDRRRELVQRSMIAWAVPLIDDALLELQEVEEEQAAEEQRHAEAKREQEIVDLQAAALHNASMADLLQEVVTRIAQQMSTPIVRRLNTIDDHLLSMGLTMTDQAVPGNQSQQSPQPKKKPKVMICGLERTQVSEITNHFKDDFKLKFVTSDEMKRVPKSQYDHVFVLRKFANHSGCQRIEKNVGPITMVEGGVSSLSDHLLELV